MLVMRTIKDPPDEKSGFTGITYGFLDELVDLNDDCRWVVKRNTNVQITSQVERTELEELVVEEHSDTEHGSDTDSYTEGGSVPHYVWKHASVEGEDTGALGSDMECADGSTDGDTDTVATTTGHNDQEDTRPTKEGCGPAIREDELDIQFVKVITT